VTSVGVRVHVGSYIDSLQLMATTVTMEECAGVEWAGAFLATPRGLDELRASGFAAELSPGLGGNDLVLAVRAVDDDAVERALESGRRIAFDERESAGAELPGGPPASVAEAVRQQPGANVAVISVPGEYAALEAHHALTAGLHVLLFSDGVSVEEEVELKERATRLGRLVMGPGAGTSILAGTGLGFANVLGGPRHGDGQVGVVAAAGTGAQEVSVLLDGWGVGVSEVIGVGGRDLSEEVAGRTTIAAARALDADPRTSTILLVSKPPSAAVAARALDACGDTPVVAVFLGLSQVEKRPTARVVTTLEEGALLAARCAGATPPSPGSGLASAVAAAMTSLRPGRTAVRGLYSGGTLCVEAQLILEGALGTVYSNEPLRPAGAMPAPPGSHLLLDLGAEQYTRGVPHPMIDLSTRVAELRTAAADPSVAVVLLDVVLGLGSHDDPAGVLAPECAALTASGAGVVAYVLGTEGDPQGVARQRATLEQAGCVVPATNARAAHAAAALALRRTDLVGVGL
jgi:FdrA protein